MRAKRSGESVAPRKVALTDLLRDDDDEFVRGAYQSLLGRLPADAEIDAWRGALSRGTAKADVVAAIRTSREGRACGVEVAGIQSDWRKRVRTVPILGYAMRWCKHLATLPDLARRVDAAQGSLARHDARDAEHLASLDALSQALHDLSGAHDAARARSHLLATDVSARFDAVVAELRRLEPTKADRAQVESLAARLDAATGELRRLEPTKADRAQVENLAARIDAVAAELGDVVSDARRLAAAKAERTSVEDLSVRASALSEWLLRLDGALRAANLLPPADEGADRDVRFDDYYRRFEDHFRGTPETIRERLMFYVPMLRQVAGIPEREREALVVDLGCGRGEMVRLLAEQGVPAYGIDNSATSVESCRAEGLDVREADAIEHLRSLAADSLVGITSIHVIEHLPFPALMTLVREAFRTLRPGGVAIFETPNPENLIVGACNFYYDPSHVRPLPPEPLRFLLEAIGFEPISIERLHAGTTLADVERAADPVARLYSTIMLVPQDYALIAYKPNGPARA